MIDAGSLPLRITDPRLSLDRRSDCTSRSSFKGELDEIGQLVGSRGCGAPHLIQQVEDADHGARIAHKSAPDIAADLRRMADELVVKF